MNPMTQEPDETVEAIIFKERWSSEGSGYSLGQRGSGGWYVIADERWFPKVSTITGFDGWWPLDIWSVIAEPVKSCKTCGHALADHHKLHCEADPCEFCNGWKCPEHDLILCGCTYMGGPPPA